MKKIKKWLNKQVSMFVLATANVEKDMLSQKEPNAEDVNHVLSIHENTLMDALIRGEVTVAVQELRWKMYETIKRSGELRSSISHYITDTDGSQVPVYVTKEITNEDIKRTLNKVKLDNFDSFPLKMVIDNSPITLSTKDIDLTINENDEIKNEDFNFKSERLIKIGRSAVSKFNIEDYAKRLNVRIINNDEYLLEFVFSKYVNEYDKKTTLFISELKRLITNPRSSNIIDINLIGFITNKCIGVRDFLEFQYEVIKFDKIIEFEGDYIMKFKVKPIINGIDITEKYSGGELEKKYKNKEARDINI